jgi:hypothetical protein
VTTLLLFLACTAGMAFGTVIGGYLNRRMDERTRKEWEGRIRR